MIDCSTLKSSRAKAASNLSSSCHHYVANFQTDAVEFLAITTQFHNNPSSDAHPLEETRRGRCQSNNVPVRRLPDITAQPSKSVLTHFHSGVALNQSKGRQLNFPKEPITFIQVSGAQKDTERTSESQYSEGKSPFKLAVKHRSCRYSLGP